MLAVEDHPVSETAGWVWCVYTDQSKPAGHRFAGVVITEAARLGALSLFGLDPGCDMSFVKIPLEHLPPVEYRNRLLKRGEARMAAKF